MRQLSSGSGSRLAIRECSSSMSATARAQPSSPHSRSRSRCINHTLVQMPLLACFSVGPIVDRFFDNSIELASFLTTVSFKSCPPPTEKVSRMRVTNRMILLPYQVCDVQAGRLRRGEDARRRRATDQPTGEVRRQRVVGQQRAHEACRWGP